MKRLKTIRLLALVLTIIIWADVSGAASLLSVNHLKCEYKTNPLGIDVTKPRLCWKIEASRRRTVQSVYQIRAAGRIDDLDPAVVEREKTILADQARSSGKPENIIEKMVEGRLRKFYEESVLLEQIFVIDGETKVGKVIENAAKDAGAPIEFAGFARLELGEGVEVSDEED